VIALDDGEKGFAVTIAAYLLSVGRKQSPRARYDGIIPKAGEEGWFYGETPAQLLVALPVSATTIAV